MSESIVKVEAVSKKFCRAIKHTMFYGMMDMGRSFLGLNQHSDRLRAGEFWVVDNVSFEIKAGEILGIIGPNGAGKSTLLKLLNGIILPDKGRIEINGSVGALIEVGAGFHPMLTGRENIYINGAILGMKKKEIEQKLDEILDFAEIGEFIDSPVKHYSSGMFVRLGFAIAIHAVPDIFLVDEALAVGDANFQKKCFEKILDLRERGTSIIFVSHSSSAVERLCRESLLMKRGKMIFYGNTRECVQRYFHGFSQDNLEKAQPTERIGCGDVIFSNVFVYQEDGDKNNPNIEFGESIIIEFDYKFLRKKSNKNQIRIGIRTFEGRDIQKLFFQESPFIDNIVYPNEKVIPIKDMATVRVKILNPRFFPQTFRLDIAIAPLDMDVHLGGIANAALFNIIPADGNKRYFEYGSLSVNEFDYEVSIC